MTTVSNNTLAFGGRKIRFAALSFRQLDALKAEIDLMLSPSGLRFTSSDTREALIALILASAGNAGETIDRDFLLDNLDVANFDQIGYDLFDRNGFLAKEQEPGEAMAAASQS